MELKENMLKELKKGIITILHQTENININKLYFKRIKWKLGSCKI